MRSKGEKGVKRVRWSREIWTNAGGGRGGEKQLDGEKSWARKAGESS